MPVFISHRTVDDVHARHVYNRLINVHRIECYLDDLDQVARISGEKMITSLILSRLESCTHLLAVITDNTKGSWWVPFEVGAARTLPRAITTYDKSLNTNLPEFLKEWPVLKGNDAIDQFAIMYFKRYKTIKQALFEDTDQVNFSRRMSSVDLFHRDLKSALGQW